MKILVADDDATLRTELSQILRDDGHQVVGAADGAGWTSSSRRAGGSPVCGRS
jgi:CheY-like chemotaxis protein